MLSLAFQLHRVVRSPHLMESFSPWVLMLERAEVNEAGSEVATEVKILEYAK